MAKKTKKKTKRRRAILDPYVYLLLLVVSVLVRLPFLGAFDLVAYDGTYYINQAKGFLGNPYLSGAFPIGYPVFIALLLPIVGDGVRAAQIVSFAGGVGTLFVFYALARRLTSRNLAIVASLVLALTPLFIRLSMMTLSESIFIFWLFLGLLFFHRRKDRSFGLSMGMAAITRPEVLGVFGVLAFLRRRPPKRVLVIVVSFAAVYLVNTVVLSNTLGRMVLIPKSGFFGTSATTWKGREAWIDFTGKEMIEEELDEEGGRRNVLTDYLLRLPREIVVLGRHAMPVVFLLALYGVFKKRLFLLAAFLPFVVYPIFTVRSDPRYILPYIPPLVLYAAVGLGSIRLQRVRRVLTGLLCLSTAVGLFVNRDQLTTPVSQGFRWAKEAGIYFKGRIGLGEKVADRKPFLAFYAEAEYVEIPVGPYDEALDHLLAEDVRFVSLHGATIHALRPALRPLLYDPAVIAGELRFNQVYYRPDIALVYERARRSDPLGRELISPPTDDGVILTPRWSPDGEKIAYRVIEPSGRGAIYVVPPTGGAPQRVISEQGTRDPLTWAPDSKRIAFANASKGNMDIYVFDVFNGALEQITSHDAADTSPFWSADGVEIVFCSDRTGRQDIWSKNLTTGQLTQITTDGANLYPAVAPDGKRIAWIREGEGVVIYDRTTGRRILARSPKRVSYSPAWSPDGRFIAVTGQDWDGADVYLMTGDGAKALLVTKSSEGEGMPCWSPDGERMVIVSSRDDEYGLWVLTGLGAYTERLLNPVGMRTLRRPE